MESPSAVVVIHSAGPTSDMWELHRPTIKRLYLDEDRTLQQVMEIMRREHNLFASVKMYKRRIGLWKLDGKNLKRRHVKQIARAKVARDAVGKKSKFMLDGQVFDLENVERYVKKKGYPSLEAFVRAASPYNGVEDMEFSTPSPSPMPTQPDRSISVLDEDNDRGAAQPEDLRECDTRALTRSKFLPYVTKTANGLHSVLAMSPVSRCRRLLSLSLSPTRWSLHPNDIATASERLFRIVDSYVRTRLEGFQSNIFRGDWLQTAAYGKRPATMPTFSDECWLASTLISRKKYVEARQVLAKACINMEEHVRIEGPVFLSELIYAYLNMIDNGASLPASMVLKHISGYASVTLGIHHPIADFIQSLLQLDSTPESAVTRLLQCFLDVFEHELGPWHTYTLSIRSGYLSLISTAEAVHLSQALLTACNSSWNKGQPEWCDTMNGLLCVLYNKRQDAEAEAIAHLILTTTGTKCDDAVSMNACINALVTLSFLREWQNDIVAAIEYMKKCIQAARYVWDRDDPDLIEYMIYLAELLDEQGSKQESEAIQAEIAEFFGSPTIEELCWTS